MWAPKNHLQWTKRRIIKSASAGKGQKIMFVNVIERIVKGPYDANDVINGNVTFPELAGCYILSNLENGKVYVGKSENLNKRIACHFTGRGGHPDVYFDYRSGAAFSVQWIILADTDYSFLSEMETNLMVLLNSIRRGYNCMISDNNHTSENMLDAMRRGNTVVAFWEDMKDKFVWDLLPNGFLYDLYKEWFKRNVPSGICMGRNSFIYAVRDVAKKSGGWFYTGKSAKWSNKMDVPEYLIAQYDLTNWMDSRYRKTNELEKICTYPWKRPKDNEKYIGLQRNGWKAPPRPGKKIKVD